MINWECEVCGTISELEEIEALLYPMNHEHYEHNLCKDCFDKSCL